MIRNKTWRVFPRRPARAAAVAGVLCAALGLAGCAQNIEVPANVPEPVLAPLPLTVGVVYPRDEFSEFIYIEKLLYGPEITVELGSANVNMFDRMVRSVFEAVTELDDPSAASSDIEAILRPTVDDYAFLTPEQAGVDFYSVSIRYEVELLSPAGDLLDRWQVNSYGRTRSSGITGSNSLSQANQEALRDAAGGLALDLQNRESVLTLIEGDQ
jgi:hypothetical protein